MSDTPHYFRLDAAALDAGSGAARLLSARTAAVPTARRWAPVPAQRPADVVPLALPLRVGVVSNPRSHRNKLQHGAQLGDVSDILHASPATPADLVATLADFAARGVNLLAVDGGDGTVRDVLTAIPAAFTGRAPRMAVVPSGKTNALALDLGVSLDATLSDVLQAAQAGHWQSRAPVEIARAGSRSPPLRGFLFGAGAFVKATELAQRAHSVGAFNGVAVGLSLGWAVAQTVFGGRDNAWRAGEAMRIETADGHVVDRHFYMLFGSTLQRLPIGLKPFGAVRSGLKLLAIDAPPKRIVATLPALLGGSETPILAQRGYHRVDVDSVRVTLDGGFILDGELYDGGDLTIRRGPTLQFAVP